MPSISTSESTPAEEEVFKESPGAGSVPSISTSDSTLADEDSEEDADISSTEDPCKEDEEDDEAEEEDDLVSRVGEGVVRAEVTLECLGGVFCTNGRLLDRAPEADLAEEGGVEDLFFREAAWEVGHPLVRGGGIVPEVEH